ncbi:cyclopropane-fatty-acyl-phospholipid synthase, partial [Salmonella enterica subsp. enterica serovar Enteritidis]|nr:cyclopropane-fatty-acyl-phospholipid synthase [Salmonella enterica subsp. enterica serovar Enteritidis]
MNTLCSDAVIVNETNDNWTRMGKELLSQADIQINGSRAWDIQLHHAGFFKRVLQQ